MVKNLYNIADRMIAGQLIGERGLTAVGVAYPVTLVFVSVGIGTSTCI